MPIPPADVLDGLDGSELAVGDVDVVGDADEGLVDVGDGEELDASGLDAGLVDFSDLLVETCDFGVEEDDGDDLEGDQGGHVFDGVVVLVHADIGEQVDEVQEVVPLGHPIFEVLGDRAEILLVQRDFHTLGLDLAESIMRVFIFILLRLDLEPVAILIIFVLEEFLQNQVLVFLEHSGLAVDEGGEETEVLGREFSSTHA